MGIDRELLFQLSDGVVKTLHLPVRVADPIVQSRGLRRKTQGLPVF